MTRASEQRMQRRVRAAQKKMVNPPLPQAPAPEGELKIHLNGPIAIGVPSGDFVDADFAMALGAVLGQYKIPHVLINAKGCYVHKGRNHCVNVAKAKGCSYLWFIDSDMIFPQLALVRLLSHQKDIVGCMYSRRVAPFTNLGTPKDRSLVKVNSETALLPMTLLPTGMLLIKMSVFDAIEKHERRKSPPFRFKTMLAEKPNEHGLYDEVEEMGEDVYFCERAIEAGIDIWCDVPLSMQIGHIGAAIYRVQDDTKADAAKIGFAQSQVDGIAQPEPVRQAAE